jgi:hypothetical protein
MTYTYKLSRRLAVIFVAVVSALLLVAFGFLLGTFAHSLHFSSERWVPLLHSAATRLFYLVIVGIGCAAGRVFPFQREFEGSREFLEHMFPGHRPVFYDRWDFFLSCVLGAVLGMLIVQPTSVHTALATGLGWPFIVRFLLEGMKTTGRPPESRKLRR